MLEPLGTSKSNWEPGTSSVGPFAAERSTRGTNTLSAWHGRCAGGGEYAVMEQSDASPPYYRVFVEPAPAAAAGVQTSGAAAALDAALQAESAVYKTWRAKRAIGPAQVVVVPEGGFEALRAARLAEGASPQQLKISRTLRVDAHAAVLSGWRGK